MTAAAIFIVLETEARAKIWADYSASEGRRLNDWLSVHPRLAELVTLALEAVDDQVELGALPWHLEQARTRADVVRAALAQNDVARARRAALALVEELDRAAARYRDADVEATA